QENGWWALLWAQANNSTTAKAPLPLIGPAAPLGQMQIPGPTAGSFIAYPALACSGAGSQSNVVAFALGTAAQTRIQPAATPFDLGVPGMMAHEALNLTQPYQSTCTLPPPSSPQQGLLDTLAQLLNSESQSFYPVLQNFPGKTAEQAALSLHPTLATVWFGENELLKFVGSLGQVQPTTAQQFQADETSIIQQLQQAGAKVAVANLLDPLKTPLFVPINVPSGLPPSTVTFALLLGSKGVPAPAIAALQSYLQATYGIGVNGYVTLTGIAKIAAGAALGNLAPQLAPGDYIPDALAAAAKQQLVALNAAIAAAAAATGAALVDVNGTFDQLFAAGGDPLNAKCCSTQFGGGVFSFDGFHPSNTGYALIANLWIQALDAKFGLTIAPVNVAQIYATDPWAPH
ncbi:MAG: hypothetical protein KGM44_08455, partial [bacterium]|nr:hypothetical protein [bacterium]